MTFCLTKPQIDALKPLMKKTGAKAIVEMNPQARREFFSKALNNDFAGKSVAASFEKALASKQKKALVNWAKTTFTEKEQTTKGYKDMIAKINTLSEQGVLSPNMQGGYFENLIATSIGVDLTETEIKRINELSEKVQETAKMKPDNQFFGYNTEYFKARKEMNDYLESIAPTPIMELLFGTIGRGNLLASVKSPTTNIVSNITSFFTEPITRRILERKLNGTNSDLVKPFVEEAYKIYRDTGYDVVRMIRLRDAQRTLGEPLSTTQGAGGVRKFARYYEDIVFKKLMGTPDILAAAIHFADSLNLTTTALADQEGLTGAEHKKRARELFLEATKVSEESVKPEDRDTVSVLREGAIANALYATFQSDSWYSKVALQIRNSIDEVTGSFKVGTNLEPFVKTPVNVVGAGMEYSGLTVPFAVLQMLHNAYKGDVVLTRDIARQMIRAGLGVTIAAIIASMLDDGDYIPDYTNATEKQKEVARMTNAAYNSIRIGNKWISLDYFGVLGSAIAGMVAAKNEKTSGEGAVAFLTNAGMQIRRAPIVSTLFDTIQWLDENKKYNKTTEEISNELVGDAAGFGYSRLMPMIVSDVAKALDDKQRYNDYNSWIDDIQTQVPFARELLPPKYNDFGDVIPTENAFWTIVAGARVKTANQDEVFDEILRMEADGTNVAITTKNFADMKLAKELLSPADYNDLYGEVQQGIRNSYAKVMETNAYKKADDDEKKVMLEKTRKGVTEAILRKTGLYTRIQKYKQEKKKFDK